MLEFNKVYKYKDLCEALNLELKTGKARECQLKKLEKEYEILRKSVYFTVIKKYTEEEKNILMLKKKEEQEKERNNIKLEFNKPYAYADLRRLFNLPQLKGSQLQKQINNLKKEYEIEKDGKHYIIIKKYSEVEKQSNELKGVYQSYVESILTELIARQNNGILRMSTTELLREVGFINEDFSYCKYNSYFSSLVLKTDEIDLHDYTEIVYKQLSHLLRTIIQNLHDKHYLISRQCFRLLKVVNTGMNGTKIQSQYEVPIETKEEQDILKIYLHTTRSLGYNDVKELYAKFKDIEKFKDLVGKEINKIYPEYNAVCKVYSLSSDRMTALDNSTKIKNELTQKIRKKIEGSKATIGMEDLALYVEATIDTKRIYQIKEKFSKYGHLLRENPELLRQTLFKENEDIMFFHN